MSISDKITELENIRIATISTLKSRGSTISDNAGLSAVPSAINNLPISDCHGVDNVLYSFGLLSDIHLKDNNFGADNMNSITDYQRALTYFNDNGCSFIAIAGDIVASNYDSTPYINETAQAEWVAELHRYVSMNEQYFPNKPVYTCAGNHDANPNGHVETVADGLIGLSQEIDGKSGYTIWEETVGTPINHVVQHGNDVFIYFSMERWNYVDPSYLDVDRTNLSAGVVDPISVEWLQEQISNHEGKRIIVIFHLPYQAVGMLDPTTNGLSIYRSVLAYKNSLIGEVMYSNPNVIWINGHSHYTLDYEGDARFPHPNVFQPEGLPTMIHCCSCSYPRIVTTQKSDGTWSYTNVAEGSQGYLVDVYADKLVLKGIDFTKGNGGAFIPQAQYIINT